MRALTLLLLTAPLACSTVEGPAGATDTGDPTGDPGGTETDDSGGPAPEPLDPAQLDRTEDNLDGDGCGYPGPGSNGYGTEVGQRVANFQLIDCDGNNIEFADFFCERDDIGVHNRAILLNIGAGWCEPCRVETKDDLPPTYAALEDHGLEIVQVLFQDWEGKAPTKMFCTDWKNGDWAEGNIGQTLQFPILVDQVGDWRSIYMSSPMDQTPMNLLLDANGNIRWKLAGDRPEDLESIVEVVMDSPYSP